MIKHLQLLVDKNNTGKNIVEKAKNPEKHAKNIFNKILKELIDFNRKVIKQEGAWTINRNKEKGMKQVFLSYSYDDLAYSLALFDYFYEKDIYLYVDAMNNMGKKDGEELKDYLNTELANSSQLLYLRTINSELDIQGKQYIKPWCSWELGNYYNESNRNEKYMINLYSDDSFKNMQVHGLKLLTNIENGNLVGRKITYSKNV